MVLSWGRLRVAGVPISFSRVVSMGLRATLKKPVIDALIQVHQNRLSIKADHIEAHFLAGGRLDEVIEAYSYLRRQHQRVPFHQLCAVDLGGGSPVDAAKRYLARRVQEPDLEFSEFAEIDPANR